MKYIIAIDQSTSSSKAFLIDQAGEIVRRAARPHRQSFPSPGRAEHDAEEIFQNVVLLIDQITDGIPLSQCAALALANQRETIVLWDRKTGTPVCPAIVWQDARGTEICHALAGENESVHRLTGSDLSAYLPASKLCALFQEQPALRSQAFAGEICAGTIESFLIYRLTGGRFCSDFSNASRTQLFNLHTLQWDDALLRLFSLPKTMLAEELLAPDACFGHYRGVPICGVLGDSFATLFGQGCHTPGTVKISYGTGTSVMMNTGKRPLCGCKGLTAAVAYGFQGSIAYALEGNITCSGDTLVWLCNNLRLFDSAAEIEALAKTVTDTQGVALVPAMAGLGAPFFHPDARAMLCGMSRGTTKAHLARAALESIAQRSADVFEALRKESGFGIDRMMADGGGSKNALLMQLQSDLCGCEVVCPAASELSALGAAYMGGISVGVFKSFSSIPAKSAPCSRYTPQMDNQARERLRANWARAIRSAMNY